MYRPQALQTDGFQQHLYSPIHSCSTSYIQNTLYVPQALLTKSYPQHLYFPNHNCSISCIRPRYMLHRHFKRTDFHSICTLLTAAVLFHVFPQALQTDSARYNATARPLLAPVVDIQGPAADSPQHGLCVCASGGVERYLEVVICRVYFCSLVGLVPAVSWFIDWRSSHMCTFLLAESMTLCMIGEAHICVRSYWQSP